MIDLDKLAPLTPENVYKIKPLAYLGRGEIKAMAWIDDDTLAVATRFALWHYTREGGQRELVRLDNHTLNNYSVLKFSDNGRVLMVGDAGNQVRIYDSFSGALVSSILTEYDPALYWTCRMCSEKYLAVATKKQLQIYEIATREVVANLNVNDVFDLMFIENELLIVNKNGVHHYDLVTGMLSEPQNIDSELTILKKWLRGNYWVQKYSKINPRDTFPPIVYPTKTHKRIELRQHGRVIHILNGHKHNVEGVLLLSDSTMISFDDHDNLLLWQERQLIDSQAYMGTNHISANTDFSAIAVVNDDNEVVIWNRNSNSNFRFPHGHSRGIELLDIDEKTLISAETSGSLIYRWSISTGEILHTLKFSTSQMILSPNKKVIARTKGKFSTPGKLIVQNIDSGEILFSHHIGVPICFTPEGLLYAADCTPSDAVRVMPEVEHEFSTLDEDELLIIRVNLETGFEETYLSLAPQNWLSLSIAYYATGASEQGVAVLDFETHRLCGMFFPKYESITCVKFSPDACRVLIASLGSTAALELWEIKSGRQIFQIEIEPDNLGLRSSMVFSPDGRFIALIHQSDRVTLWKDDQFHGSIDNVEIKNVIFSPDSRLFFGIGLLDTGITVWDSKTMNLLATLTQLQPEYLIVQPDLVAISNQNGTIGLWGVDDVTEDD